MQIILVNMSHFNFSICNKMSQKYSCNFKKLLIYSLTSFITEGANRTFGDMLYNILSHYSKDITRITINKNTTKVHIRETGHTLQLKDKYNLRTSVKINDVVQRLHQRPKSG